MDDLSLASINPELAKILGDLDKMTENITYFDDLSDVSLSKEEIEFLDLLGPADPKEPK